MHNIPLVKMQERIAKLPENVRAILFSKETVKNIEAIGRQNRLMIDQIGDLSEEISLVVMGFNSPKDLAANIAQKLQIDPKIAEQITMETNAQIFSKIRGELQKLDNAAAGAPIAPEPKPYTPPVAVPQPTTDDLRPTTVQPTAIAPATPPTDLGYSQGRAGEVVGSLADQSEEVIALPAPPVPKIEVSPFEHKLKEDDIFRAPAVISEHEAPPAIPRTPLGVQGESLETAKLPPLPTKAEMKYGGKDPYKEPIE